MPAPSTKSRAIVLLSGGMDSCVCEKKRKENEDKVAEWMRKAELSVDKKQDDLARASLQRVESYREMTESFAQQVAGGRHQRHADRGKIEGAGKAGFTRVEGGLERVSRG